MAVTSQQAHAEPRNESCAAVVGRAAAQADHEIAQSEVECMTHQFADTARGPASNVDGHARRLSDPDDLRDLDDRDSAAVALEDAERRIDFAPAGRASRTADALQLAQATDAQHGVERAFAAVRHRQQHAVSARPHTMNSRGNRIRDLECGQRALERIRRDDDLLHRLSPVVASALWVARPSRSLIACHSLVEGGASMRIRSAADASSTRSSAYNARA